MQAKALKYKFTFPCFLVKIPVEPKYTENGKGGYLNEV